MLAHIELERINVFQTPVASKHFAVSWIKGHLMVTSFLFAGLIISDRRDVSAADDYAREHPNKRKSPSPSRGWKRGDVT